MLHQANKIAAAAMRPLYKAQMAVRFPRVLLLIGHMRSGSTLLTHILNTNPEITGVAESHRLYTHSSDFEKLAYDVLLSMGQIRVPKFVLDKVLHPYIKNVELLESPFIYPVFLIREPVGSIKSMIRTFPGWFGDKKLSSDQVLRRSIQHYGDRLQAISDYLDQFTPNRKFIFITHDQMISDSENTLNRLSEFLGLRQQLRSEYQTTKFTGKFGVGDPSPQIHAGSILSRVHHEFDPIVDETLLVDELAIYDRLKLRYGEQTE